MAKKVILIILSPILIILLVEIILRGYFVIAGTEIDRIKYVYSAEQIQQQRPRFMGLPFIGYGPSPDHPEHNQLGFRNREITIDKPDNVYRIVAVGGSTTYGFGVDAEESWSFQLEQILHDDYDLPHVEVINTASMGYTTWNSLSNLAFRVLDLEPDLVIVYHSTNDAKVRWVHPDCFDGQSPVRGLSRGIWREQGPNLGVLVSYRYLGIGRGWVDDPVELNSWIYPVTWTDPSCMPPDDMTTADLMDANSSIYFERNMQNIVHLTQANGADILLSTWAYYPDWVESALIPAYEEQNVIIKDIAAALDTHIVDFMDELPADESYWLRDGEHQSPTGYHEQASYYADIVADIVTAP